MRKIRLTQEYPDILSATKTKNLYTTSTATMNGMQANRNLRKRNIVCFSLARWDAPISSPAVSIAKELAKTNRVFFIEHPYSFKDRCRTTGTTSYQDGNVHVVKPPSIYPINFLPEGKLYRLLFRINQRILNRTLRSLLHSEKISEYIFINFFDPFFFPEIPRDIAPLQYIYHCMDDMSEVAYTRRHGARLEDNVIRKADITLCTSLELTKLKSRLTSKIFLLPNAANTDLFSRALRGEFKRPADLPPPGCKIVGFTGSIEYRTDFELLKKTAQAHPDKIFFLIGPVYGTEHLQSGLNSQPNVQFAGVRPFESLPAYLQFFDCAIIPYKKNKLTSSIYPLKINEYLAAGIPVVATSFSKDMRLFGTVAAISNEDADFIQAIDRVILDNTEAKRQERAEFACRNSWKKRVEELRNIIDCAELRPDGSK